MEKILDIEDFDDIVTDEDGEKWSQLCSSCAEQMEKEGH